MPPARVESWYSTGIYPHIQRALTPFSNGVPFAFLDILRIATASAVLWSLGGAIAESWRTRTIRRLVRTLANLCVAAAVLYILFLLLWGLNYRRIRMPDRLVLD